MFFSIIIPLYNRPQEIKELLDTLTRQTYKQFEVLVIEDGSVKDAAAIVESFADKLDIKYFVKPNAGQGFTRNFGFEHAMAIIS
jgi:glycosyltransferase involved in cell wall biosynthesis